MTIEFLIRILTNRLTRLQDSKIQAEASGDLERVVELASQILETEITLAELRSL
jgi:hypothetical protein